MQEFTIWYWLKGRGAKVEASLDKATESGLDFDCTYKGGRIFVEFTRQAESMETLAAQVATELRSFNIPLIERSLNARDHRKQLKKANAANPDEHEEFDRPASRWIWKYPFPSHQESDITHYRPVKP